jgi:hypothetical protein
MKKQKVVTMTNTPEILKKEDLAKELKCSTKTIERLWQSGELRSFTVTARLRASTREMLNQYLNLKMSS